MKVGSNRKQILVTSKRILELDEGINYSSLIVLAANEDMTLSIRRLSRYTIYRLLSGLIFLTIENLPVLCYVLKISVF